MAVRKLFFILFSGIIIGGCTKNNNDNGNTNITVVPPALTTIAVTDISNTDAKSGGAITSDGGSPITARGIIWSISTNPTVALTTKTIDGTGIGNFISNLTGISANTTYFVRAYATNSAGTGYGNEITFTTTSPAATITTLNCSGSTNNGTMTAGAMAINVNSLVPYVGGNGASYSGQSVPSTGVVGLTATLAAGTLENGSGTLTYAITGSPATSGTASFALSIGGQTCTLTRTVESAQNTVTDASGNTYPTVTIGTQVWMAENLRTFKYRDGSNISVVTDDTQWANNINTGVTSPMMCWYKNDSATYNANKFGALYNWYVINSTTNGNKNLCPTGWHVPTDAEWTTLINFLDPNADGGNNSNNTAGGKMKSTGTQYWQSPNTDATNSSGWSGLPGGYRNANGTFYQDGYFGYWWSSSQDNTDDALDRNLIYNSGNVNGFISNKSIGYSVRCVKD